MKLITSFNFFTSFDNDTGVVIELLKKLQIQVSSRTVEDAFLLWGLLLLPFLLSILSIVKTSMLSIPVGQVLGVSFSIFLKSLGLLVSVFLLWHEMDKNNRFLQHVCSGSKKINCDAVLSSKRSKIFS